MKLANTAIGTIFTAAVNFPLGQQPNEDFSLDAHAGETLEIIDYNEETNQYRLLNKSLDETGAWFTASTEDVKVLAGIHYAE